MSEVVSGYPLDTQKLASMTSTISHASDKTYSQQAKSKGHGGGGVVQRLVDLLNAAPRPSLTGRASHPLDALTADEIKVAAKVCREHADKAGQGPLRFNAITLQEPPKADLVAYNNDSGSRKLPRVALCILQLPNGASVAEALVDIGKQPSTLLSWQEIAGAQPMCTIDDALEAESIVLNDPVIAKLVKERYGVTNVREQLVADPWYYGARTGDQEEEGGRLMTAFLYLRHGALDNHYAHPLDLFIHLDMTKKVVLHERSWMHKEVPRIPELDSNFVHERSLGEVGVRRGLKPLNVVQPEGPSFIVDGNHVHWQKWDFRISFNFREGLVLHDLKYEDGGRLRPVMHRMSLVEIIVPYGDPRAPFNRKCAFDVVDYGMGNCCSSLDLGCDCLGAIAYFDAVLCDKEGEPLVVNKAVCMHEEDTGTAWKHVEYRNSRNDMRRGRRLVLQFVATVANYDYIFCTYLQTDGTIQYEAKLTGCLSTSILSEGEGPKPTHGSLMAPGLNAQIHQHFFCVRMDPAIDCNLGGQALTVTEVNVESMPDSPENPFGIGFFHTETALTREQLAIRDVVPARSRTWKITNPNVQNPLSGSPVAFKLMPYASPPMYALPASSHHSRGKFATHNLWVTPHRDAERWPAGPYPYARGHNDGLAEWTQADRNVEQADVVVWHSFGVTHVPRTEDWPVMPVEVVGFHLKPANFFGVNPALDIPPGPVGTNVEVSCPKSIGGACRM